MIIEDSLLNGLALGPSPEALEVTRNSKSIFRNGDITPGDVQKDGSWLDAYGIKHYKGGGTYKYSPNDKRLTANGSHSGRHNPVQFSDTEVEENPVLGLSPKDYNTVLLHMEGMSRRDIASALQISEHTVTARLAKPAVREWVATQKDCWTEDIHALTESAITVLRDAMNKGEEMHHRLMGADKVLRVTERLGVTKNNTTEETASSQLQQVLAALQVNVTVNNN
jgi:hypothetical protein